MGVIGTYQTYAETISLLDELSQVLVRLGISQRPDRIRLHTSNIRRLESAFQENRVEEFLNDPQDDDKQEKFIWSFIEGMELGAIVPTLHQIPDDVLREKLGKILKGPADPKDETTKSNVGRNTVFELSLAARLLRNGVKLVWREMSDLICEIDGREVHIQCKRPFSEGAIARNIADARRQLERDLGTQNGARGVIAISLSRVLNTGRAIFVADTPADMENLANRPVLISNKYKVYWQKIVDPKIIGIIFSLTTPAIVRKSKHPLGLAQQIVIRNLVDIDSMIGVSIKPPLIKQLARLLSDSPEGLTYAREVNPFAF